MTKLQPYAEYQSSGVNWIGEVPKQWGILPSKRVLRFVKEIVGDRHEQFSRLSLTMNGVLPRSKESADGLSPESFSTYQILRPNELVFKMIDLENQKTSRVGISGDIGLVSSAYIVARSSSNLVPKFAYYFFTSLYHEGVYNQLGSGVRSTLNADDLGRITIPLPSQMEQLAIVNFLNRETAQIDELIDKQERLIELLAEKRQAIIARAVTKGLDPSAPTKPSGIPWLGDIPAAWKVSKLSWETRGIGDGLHGTPTYSDQGSIPFVNGTNLLGGEIRITDSTNFVEEDQLSHADMSLDESTVLISINGTIGNCAVLGNRQVMLSKSAAYIKCSESLDVHFLAHYLRSHPTRSYFFATSGGTTIANLSLAALRGTPIPVPPLPMQEEITKWLNEQTQSFDELGSKAYEAARLLRERRSALISAAVTGKIDLRKEPS